MQRRIIYRSSYLTLDTAQHNKVYRVTRLFIFFLETGRAPMSKSQKSSPGLAKWNWKRDAKEGVKCVALFSAVGACQGRPEDNNAYH